MHSQTSAASNTEEELMAACKPAQLLAAANMTEKVKSF